MHAGVAGFHKFLSHCLQELLIFRITGCLTSTQHAARQLMAAGVSLSKTCMGSKQHPAGTSMAWDAAAR